MKKPITNWYACPYCKHDPRIEGHAVNCVAAEWTMESRQVVFDDETVLMDVVTFSVPHEQPIIKTNYL